MKGTWKREIPEKTRRTEASPVTTPTCEDPGATSRGFKRGSPRLLGLECPISFNDLSFEAVSRPVTSDVNPAEPPNLSLKPDALELHYLSTHCRLHVARQVANS
ncbi:hypothetical protein PR048_023602 [Dryococelus australis]|uniref:Uncharacterized protein n=1 Tax=Dryococelus australis TaxID=614101 RepID=A0ABQ9GUN1_9NEOP|nr:hypothetical protein PR048_023602 [Dryococelus australis]